MARIQFPTSKSTGTEYTANGKTFRYDGKRWRRKNTQAENAAASLTDLTATVEAELAAEKAELAAATAAAQAAASSSLSKTGGTMTGQLTLSGSSPQLKFTDVTSGHGDFWIHANTNRLYVLTDRDSNGSWETPYAMELDQSANKGYMFGSEVVTAGNISNFAGGGAGPKGCTVFTSSGTWTKPSWCNRIVVEVVGGGGGAAGYSESGGAGGYASEIINSPASTVSVTVGGGGGSVQYYAAAGNGGTSSFGSYCSAGGGYGSNRNFSHSGGAGGIGSGGHINTRGGGGTGHTNSNASGSPAKGGASYFGGGAGDNRGASNSKVSHGAPGSGGPGSRGDTRWRGAPGESGIVVVWEFE